MSTRLAASHNCQTSSTLKTGVTDRKRSVILPPHGLLYTPGSSGSESAAAFQEFWVSFPNFFPATATVVSSLKMESLISSWLNFVVCWRWSAKRHASAAGLALASHSRKPLKYPKQVCRPRTTVPTALIWILIWVVLPTEKVRSVMATDNWQRTCGTLAFSMLSKSPAKAPPRYGPLTDYWCANLPPRWRRLCWRSHWVHQQTQRNGRANTPICTYLPTLIILAWQTHAWGEKEKEKKSQRCCRKETANNEMCEELMTRQETRTARCCGRSTEDVCTKDNMSKRGRGIII